MTVLCYSSQIYMTFYWHITYKPKHLLVKYFAIPSKKEHSKPFFDKTSKSKVKID